MKLRINIDGKEYEAEIEVLDDERHDPPAGYGAARSGAKHHASIAAPTDTTQQRAADDEKSCRSPVVGIVVTVLVREGQNVNVGETLLVLEAMKMESNIISPMSGRIKRVPAAPGASVKKGQVLVEFE